MTTTRGRRHGLVAAVALVLLALSACGDSSGEKATAADPSSTPSDAFPVTLDQQPEPVTIEEEPTRVVALDFPSADAAIALGVVPVGMVEISYVEGGVQAWTKEALAGEQPELIPVTDVYPFEAIAALRPDVLLATNAYPLVTESWDELNAIAPVVANVEAPWVDTWQQGLELVGHALGRSDEAAEVIAEVEGGIAEARAEHPEFEGKTASFFNYATGGLYVINRETDFSMKLLTELGFAGITDTVAAMPEHTVGGARALVSPEQYELIEADLVLGTSSDGNLAELESHPIFGRVPAVERGSFLAFDIGPATALAFPSALSLPYALDQLLPQLSEAVSR